MNLPKAIELNNESEKSLRDHKFIDHADAVKLGTEAMKLLEHQRTYLLRAQETILPGETNQ